MKKIRTEDAVGHALCHDITAIRDGRQGALFQRGHVVRPEDVQAMQDIGKFHIFVWEPGVDEVHEEDAARALTERIAGPNIAYAGPAQGKFVLTSKIRGLYRSTAKGFWPSTACRISPWPASRETPRWRRAACSRGRASYPW